MIGINGRRLLFLLPMAGFACLVAGLFVFLPRAGEDGRLERTALKAAPEFFLPPVDKIGASGLARSDFVGKGVSLLNIWASWCAPCRAEHPFLMELRARGDVQMTGIAYKDSPENAGRFLNRFGNPFERLGIDETGAGVLGWGIYGVPETFILDGRGRIILRHFGPITEESLKRDLLPAIARARADSGG